MEKNYIIPDMDITEFDNDDVITASGTPSWSAPNTPGEEGWGLLLVQITKLSLLYLCDFGVVRCYTIYKHAV